MTHRDPNGPPSARVPRSVLARCRELSPRGVRLRRVVAVLIGLRADDQPVAIGRKELAARAGIRWHNSGLDALRPHLEDLFEIDHEAGKTCTYLLRPPAETPRGFLRFPMIAIDDLWRDQHGYPPAPAKLFGAVERYAHRADWPGRQLPGRGRPAAKLREYLHAENIIDNAGLWSGPPSPRGGWAAHLKARYQRSDPRRWGALSFGHPTGDKGLIPDKYPTGIKDVIPELHPTGDKNGHPTGIKSGHPTGDKGVTSTKQYKVSRARARRKPITPDRAMIDKMVDKQEGIKDSERELLRCQAYEKYQVG